MTTLQVYKLIIRFVTQANSLAAKMMKEEITKTEALEAFKAIIEEAGKAVE